MTDKISDAVIDEMLAGLEGVTPGPWEVVGSSLTDFGREWEASLSMEFIPNGREDGINSRADNDLAHLARCDPDTIRSLLIELRSYRTASNPLQAVVKVKPLEWEDIKSAREDGPAEPTGDIEALTLIGEYSVCFDGDDAVSETPWCAWSPVENIGHFADFEEAKAAALADYERRILSALETTPAPVIRAEFRTEAGGLVGSTHAPVSQIERQNDGSFTVIIDHWTTPAPVSEITEEMVGEAMLDAWNDICGDTGCNPLDIQKSSRGQLGFNPSHWASLTAQFLTAAMGGE